MITAAKAPVAVTALEGLLAGVLARVPSQLVASGKLPSAALPLADVGLLPRVGASVCLRGELRVSVRIFRTVSELVLLVFWECVSE